jgi:hypothetical protein
MVKITILTHVLSLMHQSRMSLAKKNSNECIETAFKQLDLFLADMKFADGFTCTPWRREACAVVGRCFLFSSLGITV